MKGNQCARLLAGLSLHLCHQLPIQNEARETHLDPNLEFHQQSSPRKITMCSGSRSPDTQVDYWMVAPPCLIQFLTELNREAIDARIEAARKGTQVIDAPSVVVPEVQP